MCCIVPGRGPCGIAAPVWLVASVAWNVNAHPVWCLWILVSPFLSLPASQWPNALTRSYFTLSIVSLHAWFVGLGKHEEWHHCLHISHQNIGLQTLRPSCIASIRSGTSHTKIYWINIPASCLLPKDGTLVLKLDDASLSRFGLLCHVLWWWWQGTPRLSWDSNLHNSTFGDWNWVLFSAVSQRKGHVSGAPDWRQVFADCDGFNQRCVYRSSRGGQPIVGDELLLGSLAWQRSAASCR